MQKLGHTWPLFIFVRERVSTSQLALPCSSRQHKENKIQLGWALSCCLFWARVRCQGITPHHPAAILWREYEEDWFAWLFILLCSPEPEKIAGGNNSRRIQSLHNTIFQTLSVFESYVLFSLRKKEFPSVSAWETAWLPHLRQIFQSGSKQTVTMNRGACYSSRVDWASPRNQLQHWAPLWLWQQGSCLENSFCSPVDSRPFLGLTSAEWSLRAYSFILFFFLFWLFLYFPKPIWCCGWVSFPVFRSVSPSTQSHVPLKPNANLSFAEMCCELNAEGALSSWENRVVSRSVPECQVSVMHWDRDAQTLSASTGTATGIQHLPRADRAKNTQEKFWLQSPAETGCTIQTEGWELVLRISWIWRTLHWWLTLWGALWAPTSCLEPLTTQQTSNNPPTPTLQPAGSFTPLSPLPTAKSDWCLLSPQVSWT